MNTFLTPSWVANQTALRFMNSVHGAPNFNRSYDKQFKQAGAKVGNTVQARLPWRPTVRRGSGWSPQAMTDRTVPVSLTYQDGVDFDWTSAQRTTEIDEVKDRYVNKAADAMASTADMQAMLDVYKSVYHAVGTPGTTPSTQTQYLDAGVKITDMAGKEDERIAVLDPKAAAYIGATVAALFNPREEASSAARKGRLDQKLLAIDEWFQDQNVPKHVTGSHAACSPTVNGASQTGSSLVTQSWTTMALKAGDVFTIAGVNSVNPLTRQSTGRLQQFVLTADATDSGGAATLSISPSIITSGQLQTVDASPASGAAISVWGTAAAAALTSVTSPQSLIFVPDFAAFAIADLVDPGDGTGAKAAFARSEDWNISIRFLQSYMIEGDVLGSRLDILYGAAPIRPELACRMVG